MSCAYAFILTMTSKEGEGLKAVARESLVISLGYYPSYPSILQNFQPWSILLTFVFPFYLTWSSYRSYLSYLPSFLYPVIQLNFIFEWLESIIRLVSQVVK